MYDEFEDSVEFEAPRASLARVRTAAMMGKRMVTCLVWESRISLLGTRLMLYKLETSCNVDPFSGISTNRLIWLDRTMVCRVSATKPAQRRVIKMAATQRSSGCRLCSQAASAPG